MDKEIIICSAVLLDDGKMLYCRCHADCLVALKTFYKSKEKQQGFVTSLNRFVDRKEARRIAIKAFQCKTKTLRDNELLSEDLY